VKKNNTMEPTAKKKELCGVCAYARDEKDAVCWCERHQLSRYIGMPPCSSFTACEEADEPCDKEKGGAQ
jgi:hypothetical protein